MAIAQSGSVNTASLIVPGVLIQIVPPQNLVINGVPTNRIGVVGTATWGPVSQAVIVSSAQSYQQAFGPIQNRKYDMGTPVNTACQQGAADFRCVRVTDTTDVAAGILIATNAITFTALYTGTLGNTITVTFSAGSKASTNRLIVTCPNFPSEVYDNIAGTGNAFWLAVAAAVNTGAGQLRGASQLLKAVAGVGTTAVTLGTAYVLGTTTPGTDGATTITSTVLVGNDASTPRTGMYALRNQGCSIAMLSDADDSTQWTSQGGFALSEGIYMMCVAPGPGTAGNTIITNGTTGSVDVKATAGVDNYAVKFLHGDWVYWNDQVNNVIRLVSPQGFVAGRLANLSPAQSSMNKQLFGVVGTQKSGLPGSPAWQVYADADLQELFQFGVDVISNPQPGGTFWGVRGGLNSNSNAGTNGDNYTRMTNFIAATLNAGMGQFVGMTITPTIFTQVNATISSFLNNLVAAGILGLTTSGGVPYSVVCGLINNPFSRTSLGILQADVQVQYMAIVRDLIINLEGSQVTIISKQTTPAGQI